MASTRVEIIGVGDEILSGDTRDRDANTLARAVADLGGTVERITFVRDDVEAIATAVREALARGTTLLLTAGGLGPTPDDITAAGVARALGRELVLDRAARAFIAERYRELAQRGDVADPALARPREKMAFLPQGARWLPNEVGTAPAPYVEDEGRTIVSLPGPPAELEAILHGPLEPILRDALGASAVARARYRLAIDDETPFAAVHDRVAPAHRHVYVKSHAPKFGGRGSDHALLVTLAARGRDERQARERLEAAASDLERQLVNAAIEFERESD